MQMTGFYTSWNRIGLSFLVNQRICHLLHSSVEIQPESATARVGAQVPAFSCLRVAKIMVMHAAARRMCVHV